MHILHLSACSVFCTTVPSYHYHSKDVKIDRLLMCISIYMYMERRTIENILTKTNSNQNVAVANVGTRSHCMDIKEMFERILQTTWKVQTSFKSGYKSTFMYAL